MPRKRGDSRTLGAENEPCLHALVFSGAPASNICLLWRDPPGTRLTRTQPGVGSAVCACFSSYFWLSVYRPTAFFLYANSMSTQKF